MFAIRYKRPPGGQAGKRFKMVDPEQRIYNLLDLCMTVMDIEMIVPRDMLGSQYKYEEELVRDELVRLGWGGIVSDS